MIILIKFSKVHGYVLKRLAKCEPNLWVESSFTMSQSVGMEIRFVLESTYGITHYVRSIPITLSECIWFLLQQVRCYKLN